MLDESKTRVCYCGMFMVLDLRALKLHFVITQRGQKIDTLFPARVLSFANLRIRLRRLTGIKVRGWGKEKTREW